MFLIFDILIFCSHDFNSCIATATNLIITPLIVHLFRPMIVAKQFLWCHQELMKKICDLVRICVIIQFKKNCRLVKLWYLIQLEVVSQDLKSENDDRFLWDLDKETESGLPPDRKKNH